MAHTPTRRLRPVHIVIAAVLVLAMGVLIYEWAHIVPTVAGHPPPAVPSSNTITPEQAQAEVQGGSRDGSNSSQDAYTSQNQSREPAETRRPQ